MLLFTVNDQQCVCHIDTKRFTDPVQGFAKTVNVHRKTFLIFLLFGFG